MDFFKNKMSAEQQQTLLKHATLDELQHASLSYKRDIEKNKARIMTATLRLHEVKKQLGEQRISLELLENQAQQVQKDEDHRMEMLKDLMEDRSVDSYANKQYLLSYSPFHIYEDDLLQVNNKIHQSNQKIGELQQYLEALMKINSSHFKILDWIQKTILDKEESHLAATSLN